MVAGGTSTRDLSALLSQVLVAFTVEFDSDFERRMAEAGFGGARLSLVLWTGLLRFVGDGARVRDLAALVQDTQVNFQLGCLERWGFVELGPDGPDSGEKREGWGSGRGIRGDWMVRLTPKGRAACGIWPPLFGEIERRWENRFGRDAIERLRRSLQRVVNKRDVELPTLLSQASELFRLEFDGESPAPLVHCANTLRVLGEKPIRAAEIPRLTGGSRETSDIGWELKPYVVVTREPAASRGKVVSLSSRGVKAQQTYFRLIREIEKRWEERFGKETVGDLREALLQLFDRLPEGLVPPAGTVRAGAEAPSLGRRSMGAAARQRMRDMVAQTERFRSDPSGSLPHFPAWDMNRGFGP